MVANITLSGNVTDFGLQPMASKQLHVDFIPSGPAFSGAHLLASDVKTVVPDSSGAFSIDLQITEGLQPDAWYSLRFRWLDDLGNVARQDDPGWQIRIPVGGGDFGTIIQTSLASAFVIVSETRPTVAFLWWFQPSTGDLYSWIG